MNRRLSVFPFASRQLTLQDRRTAQRRGQLLAQAERLVESGGVVGLALPLGSYPTATLEADTAIQHAGGGRVGLPESEWEA